MAPRPYSQLNIEELEALFDSSKRDFEKLNAISQELEHRKTRRARSLSTKVNQWITEQGEKVMVRGQVEAFGDTGNVPVSLAQDLIRSSTYWISHPQGITHPEPKWADRIEKGPHGLEVRFGSNKFLAERAILLSKDTILDEITHSEKHGTPIDYKLLYRRLITCVRRSASNYADKIFEYYKGGAEPEVKKEQVYENEYFSESRQGLVGFITHRFGYTPPSKDYWKGYMMFGVHAIKVDNFVNAVLRPGGRVDR